MSDDDLIGLRDGDLSELERRRQAHQLSSPAHQREHDAMMSVGTVLQRGRVPPGPSAVELLGRRASGRRRAAVAAVAVAAALVLSVGTGDHQRDKGAGGGGAAVRLQAAVDGSGAPVSEGASLSMEQWVVFAVQSDRGGVLTIWEGDRQILPERGAWAASAGTNLAGGQSPLAYQPERPGTHRYTARLCADEASVAPEQPECWESSLVLRWGSAP